MPKAPFIPSAVAIAPVAGRLRVTAEETEVGLASTTRTTRRPVALLKPMRDAPEFNARIGTAHAAAVSGWLKPYSALTAVYRTVLVCASAAIGVASAPATAIAINFLFIPAISFEVSCTKAIASRVYDYPETPPIHEVERSVPDATAPGQSKWAFFPIASSVLLHSCNRETRHGLHGHNILILIFIINKIETTIGSARLNVEAGGRFAAAAALPHRSIGRFQVPAKALRVEQRAIRAIAR